VKLRMKKKLKSSGAVKRTQSLKARRPLKKLRTLAREVWSS
jgi:hypothetical protein